VTANNDVPISDRGWTSEYIGDNSGKTLLHHNNIFYCACYARPIKFSVCLQLLWNNDDHYMNVKCSFNIFQWFSLW